MNKLLIFGGTTEGRLLAEFCAEQGIPACICVTTDYGADLLPASDQIQVLVGKLDLSQIQELLLDNDFSWVIDATHPYAVLATQNIRQACDTLGRAYYRIIRRSDCPAYGTQVESLTQIVEILNRGTGRIFSVLGSKELEALTQVKNYRERIWIRVIPGKGIEEYCEKLGFARSHIFLGKGPFSVEENIAHIRQSGAELLVTKESGAAGGYPEKVQAAQFCGIDLLTLKRPPEIGVTLDEMEQIMVEAVKK